MLQKPGRNHRPGAPGVALGLALAALLGLSACDDETPAAAADAATDAGSVADAATAADGADAGATLQPAPAVAHAASCAANAPLPEPWTPPGCAHQVVHPDAVAEAQASCGSASAPPTLLRTTFPTSDPSHDIAFVWMGEAGDLSARVRYGETPELLDREVTGHTFTLEGFEGRRTHEVHLCGLEAGRTWYYQAGGTGADGTEHWSAVTPITTLPAKGSDDAFTLALTGDTRTPTFNALWADALHSILDKGADFLLFSGDAVELGLVQRQWDAWFEAGEGVFDRLPVMPTNGNHDLLTANYLASFALPGDEENFHIRFGNTLIISLNDLPLRDRNAVTGSTRQYLQATLEANTDATWRILLHHRAHYSASNHGSFEGLQEAWAPLIDAHHIDLVVNGHDHNYERTVPIRGGAQVPAGSGTIYTVVAGIGAPMYSSGEEWWTAKSESVPSFAILKVDGRRAEYTAWRLDGTMLDQLVLEK